MPEPARLSFTVEYFDPHAGLVRSYAFNYYNENDTIEMFDLKTKRSFLKRCTYPSLDKRELFVGATINVFSRPLKVVDYGDIVTRNYFSSNTAESTVLITSRGMGEMGNVVDLLTVKCALRIINIRMVNISSAIASKYQAGKRGVVLVVSGSGAAEKCQDISAQYGGSVVNVTDAADTAELHALLGPGPTTAVMQNCAVCVIRPHAITSGYEGAILQRLIEEGFDLTAVGMYSMTVADAEDFLEVYNGVVPEYKKLVEQMSSGACIAVEICAENAVAALRAVCGPHDPEVCHVLFPHTLRSKYGVDRTRNAVHCTDLDEDGPLESEFFFSLMQNKQQ